MLHKSIDMAQPGDVIVCDAGGDLTNSLMGELMLAYAVKRGVAGFVLNGAIRDLDAIRKVNLPIFAAGVTHRGPCKDGPGEINVAISLAGMVIEPGDIVIGDRRDLLTALIFMALGMLGLILARGLEAGTLAQIGPGFLPRVVCVLLVLVGLAIGLPALRRPAISMEPAKARPLLVILVANLRFGLAVTHLGSVLAALWLVVVGSLADPGGTWRQTLALAVGLAAFGAVVFVYGPAVQVPLWAF